MVMLIPLGQELGLMSDVQIREWVDHDKVVQLEGLLNYYGSDKAGFHDYHHVYQPILKMLSFLCQNGKVRLLEIGLGSNNLDVKSNMGLHGRPGASARAFRDFLPSSSIHGADIDERILFQEERIDTSWVDQLSKQSLHELMHAASYDIIIDDGLHTIEANLNTFAVARSSVAQNGWIVIEDIANIPECSDLWLGVAEIMSLEFDTFLLETRGGGLMFLAHKSK